MTPNPDSIDTSSDVERVARALMRQAGEDEEHTNGFGGYVTWHDYRDQAIAAIAALSPSPVSREQATAEIVAWLRENVAKWEGEAAYEIADAIERGDHHARL